MFDAIKPMPPASFCNPFREKGSWFKGNIHTHTTNSDGALDTEQISRLYKANGYDFIFITDHNKATEVKQLREPLGTEFLVMPGVEFDIGRSEAKTSFHIVALDLDHLVETKDDPQSTIDRIVNEGGVAVVGHPYWSALASHDILRLEGYLGIEVFNSTCHFSVAKGYSLIHWDDLLVRNRYALGFAVDDAHYHSGPLRPVDACYAWIAVKAKDLTVESLMNSISKGLFYSSTGPKIFDVEVKEQSVHVKSSPARLMSFITTNGQGERFTALKEPLTDVEYNLRGNETYLRIEVEDEKGGVAWTNPMVFRESQKSS